MDFPQLVGAYNEPLSSAADSQRAINCYVERNGSGFGRGAYALYRQWGMKTWKNTGKAISRGSLLDPTNSHLFTVFDDTIYDLLVDGTINAQYGPIDSDGLMCSMDESQNSLFVVSNHKLYRVFGGAVSQPVLDFTPQAVGVLGTLVLAIAAGTNRIYYSVDDGATWPALSYVSAEAYPNQLLNMVIDHQEAWVFGSRRTQVFVLSDDPAAPIQKVQSANIEVGLGAEKAVAKMDNTLFWMGSDSNGDHVFYRANGYTPQIVSTEAVCNAIRKYSLHEDAVMQSLQVNGHTVLRVTFPSANQGLGATWQYDASVPKELAWTMCSYWNKRLGRHERHRGQSYVTAFGKILVGDYANGWLYEMGPDFYTDFGYPLRMERRTPHIAKENRQIQYHNFEVVAQTGVGLTGAAWLHSYNLDPATFATNLAAAVAGGTVTAAQSTVLQAIYDQAPYDQDVALPGDDVLTPLGFYEWGRNPELGMRYSDDNSNNFTATSYRSLGRAGRFFRKLRWWFLGQGNQRVWEIICDAPTFVGIVGGVFDATVCDQ